MVAAQQWDRVIALTMKALQGTQRIPVGAEALNSALMHMRSASSQGLHAMKLQSMMQEANVPIAPRARARLNSPPGL